MDRNRYEEFDIPWMYFNFELIRTVIKQIIQWLFQRPRRSLEKPFEY